MQIACGARMWLHAVLMSSVAKKKKKKLGWARRTRHHGQMCSKAYASLKKRTPHAGRNKVASTPYLRRLHAWKNPTPRRMKPLRIEHELGNLREPWEVFFFEIGHRSFQKPTFLVYKGCLHEKKKKCLGILRTYFASFTTTEK